MVVMVASSSYTSFLRGFSMLRCSRLGQANTPSTSREDTKFFLATSLLREGSLARTGGSSRKELEDMSRLSSCPKCSSSSGREESLLCEMSSSRRVLKLVHSLGGSLLSRLKERLTKLSSVFLIRWKTASGTCTS